LRKDASLLVSAGNTRQEVETWPLSRIWVEAEIVRQRIRQHSVFDVLLIHVAIIDAFAGGRHLQNTIEGMLDE
jgi:hypothetical protein